MKRTAPFRGQHLDIDAIITRLSQLLVDTATLRAKAKEARNILALLSGKVRTHLAMEERSLYPQLLAHKDPAVRATARRFQAEVGPLGKQFFDYVSRWPHEHAVAADPAGFGRETRDILRALAARMLAEDTELYAAVDAAPALVAASGRATSGR